MPADQRPPKRSRRAIVDGDGRLHESTTAAALANGISPCGAWTRAKFRKRGWYFPDEVEAPPQAPQAQPVP
jgi:hypothetical protein